MKSKKLKPIVYIVGMMALFLLQGCDKENEQEPEIPPTNSTPVKQVDMKVVIPVHPSSLNYFDYVVCYLDNTGEEYRDTISQNVSTQALDEDIYYIKNFVYKSIPVVCRCEVNLRPKVSRDCLSLEKVDSQSQQLCGSTKARNVRSITTRLLDFIQKKNSDV